MGRSCLPMLLLAAVMCVNQCQCDERSKNEDESNGALISVETEDDDNYDDSDIDANVDFMSDVTGTFKPSKEWQKVEPGQAIPQGLHVRLNLQTGDREAKLLDGEEEQMTEDSEPSRHERMKMALTDAMKELESSNSENAADENELKYWKNADKEGMVNIKNRYFTRDQLKHALKKFKVSREYLEQPVDSGKKFRSIEDIRKDFKSLNMDMKTDLELLIETLERYRNKDLSHDGRIAVLTDLEYYLHQIDNGKNFADMGGMSLIVADLNSTFEDVRIAAALVISSAVQSNPSVQVSAIEAGAMQQLIRMLSTDSSLAVRIRSLTALSSLVRHFPFAQRKLVELGGLQALSDLLAQSHIAIDTEKLCVKAATLINDLLIERASVLSDSTSSDKMRQERINQYAQVPLLESIIEHGWCQLVPKLLSLPEHDSRENVLGLMWTLRISCRTEFSRYLTVLDSLRQEYSVLSGQERRDTSSNDDVLYFAGLLQTVNNVIGDVSVVNEEL